MNFYNGYSPRERARKQYYANKVFPGHTHPLYRGTCQICGDPDAKVEPHTEDYAEPYLWENPAEYAVCKVCHMRLHGRFAKPHAWEAYKRHVRRGGYGSDMKTPAIAREVREAALNLETGNTMTFRSMSRDVAHGAEAWWEKLSTDPATQTDRASRPRP